MSSGFEWATCSATYLAATSARRHLSMHVGTTPQMNTEMAAAFATAPDEDVDMLSCLASDSSAPLAPTSTTLKRDAPSHVYQPHHADDYRAGTAPCAKRRRCSTGNEGAPAVTSLASPPGFATGKAAPGALIDMPHVPFATLQRVAVPQTCTWSMGPQ